MTPVSMNFWGFTPDYFDYSVEYFKAFLSDPKNMENLKSELFIPLLGDKLIKSAVPALAGLVAGKAFQMIWDKGTSKRTLRKGLAADAPQSLAMSLAFAAVSAALGAVVSQLSDRGSKAFVDHRHRKPSRLSPGWMMVSVG